MESIDPLLAELIESLPVTPAVLVNPRWDVLASNALAVAISPSLAVGVNLAEATFVGLSARRTLPDWQDVSAQMVGLLRTASREPGGPDRLEALLDELARRSPDFRAAWTAGDSSARSATGVTMDHPEVGRLEMRFELMRVPDVGQTLVLGHVAKGSSSEQRLFELAARIEDRTA